jgi:hypothetical protein
MVCSVSSTQVMASAATAPLAHAALQHKAKAKATVKTAHVAAQKAEEALAAAVASAKVPTYVLCAQIP